MNISLQDKAFTHSKNNTSSDYFPNNDFTWSRAFPYESEVTVFTDFSMSIVEKRANKKNIAWILEPYEISMVTWKYLYEKWMFFDAVVTHDRMLLHSLPNAIYLPYGDCWIMKKDWKMYTKSKFCSMFCSDKKATVQHIFRHECLKVEGVEHFGYMNRLEYKLAALSDYKFHIVVENSKRDGFFTEKIMDCFATGTIPIYCGTKNIGNYFDTRGIITFDTLEQLDDIINNLKLGIVTYEQDYLQYAKINYKKFRRFVGKENRLLRVLKEKEII